LSASNLAGNLNSYPIGPDWQLYSDLGKRGALYDRERRASFQPHTATPKPAKYFLNALLSIARTPSEFFSEIERYFTIDDFFV
jgi:hypothetical protein